MTLSKDDVAAMSLRQKIRASEAESLDRDLRRALQLERAYAVARSLCGKTTPPRGLVATMLALVEADERPAPPEQSSGGPAGGARQVLKPKKKPEPAAQETLW